MGGGEGEYLLASGPQHFLIYLLIDTSAPDHDWLKAAHLFSPSVFLITSWFAG